jgi:exodeoxyribonuclease VII large subunit
VSESQIPMFDGRETEPGTAELDPGLMPKPGSTPETAVPVSEVNAAVRHVLEQSFAPLWIRGEIANWRPHRSGHRWFSLRDDSSQLQAVMWRSDAARLPTEPEEGMEVFAFGSLTLYEPRGQYQFVVRRLEAKGEGLWRLAFERLKQKLQAEGLLDPERKRPLPRVPMTVGIVTSRSGAALRDMLAVIRRRAPWTRVLVSDCRVQGEGAALEIEQALERLVAEGTSDVIVLTRGGGSIEDLWEFNDESLARAIAGCPIPTVSAVGHEIDFTISDLVADVRAPTPSAAAEGVTEDAVALSAELRARAGDLVEGLRRRTRTEAERTRRAAGALRDAWHRGIAARRSRLAVAAGRLDGLSPIGALRRGFGVALDANGRVLRSAREFEPGTNFVLRLTDGRISATVDSVDLEAPQVPANPDNARVAEDDET